VFLGKADSYFKLLFLWGQIYWVVTYPVSRIPTQGLCQMEANHEDGRVGGEVDREI